MNLLSSLLFVSVGAMVGAVSVPGFAHAAVPPGTDCFKAEKELYDKVHDEWQNAGDGPVTDVLYAELNLLEARYQCQNMTLVDYCAGARTAAATFLEGTLDGSRLGQYTKREIVDAQRVVRTVEKTCTAIPK